MSMIQDLPLSKPHTSSDLDQLITSKEIHMEACTYYIDLYPAIVRLVGMLERMKGIADVVKFATCKVRAPRSL